MGEAGIFRPDACLALIEGEIFEISTLSPRHAGVTTHLVMLLGRTDGKWVVSTQHPIRLSEISEAKPDVALLRWRDDFYRGAHPTPADVLLVIEVAETTVAADRKVKLPFYASAGIAEAWLVNIPEKCVEIYSDPAGGVYQRAEVFGRGAEARSHTVAGLAVAVGELLG
jgi:Uma2 family endonuclease